MVINVSCCCSTGKAPPNPRARAVLPVAQRLKAVADAGEPEAQLGICCLGSGQVERCQLELAGGVHSLPHQLAADGLAVEQHRVQAGLVAMDLVCDGAEQGSA
jgi:hypothetical protein